MVYYPAMNRMRVTKSKRNSRRSHHGIVVPAYSTDADGTVRMRHRASRVTGMYRGRSVLPAQESATKAEKSKQEDGEKKTVEQAEVPK